MGVGCRVGLDDGCPVGREVGAADGHCVGVFVGALEGHAVGARVVGICVGMLESVIDGDVEGRGESLSAASCCGREPDALGANVASVVVSTGGLS